MSVEVEVRSQLLKIVEDLERIEKANQEVSRSMTSVGENVGKQTKRQTKEVQGFLSQLQSFGRRVADQLRKDFMSLGSLASLTAGLKLSDQFSGSIKESVNLADSVRRYSSVLGIARKDFSSFQTLLQSGLGEIGASSEAAANALKGLAETPVRGQKNLLAYARTAAELASISGEKGQEGNIAKGAAGIITARGGNVNDQAQLGSVAKEILQIRQATGKSVTEITAALQSIYSGTNKDFQKNLKGGGSTSLASGALLGGPQATSFLEKYLGMDRIQRKGLEAQGFQNVVGKNGELNTRAILSTLTEAKSRGLGDAQAGLKTYGFSDDEAKGFIRLAEALKANEGVINGAHKAVVNLNDEYHKSMGLGDSFRANVNKVKSIFAPAISGATQMGTDLLGKAGNSTAGAIGVTAGAGVLAAVLTGGGLRGLGKGLMGGGIADEAKAKAFEAATGEHVQRVEVINWPSSLGGVAGAGAGIMGTAGKAALGAGALSVGAAAGYGLAKGTSYLYDKAAGTDIGKAAGLGDFDKKIQDVFDKIIFRLQGFNPDPNALRVRVDLNKRDLKASVPPGRGSSQ